MSPELRKNAAWSHRAPDVDATDLFYEREPDAYAFTNLLGNRPNVSHKPWPRWAISLTAWCGAGLIAVLLFWAWLAWCEGH